VRHFLSTGDWSPEELDEFLHFAARVKSGAVNDQRKGQVLGLLFFNPSLRTRTSFEAAMLRLGGHAIPLDVGGGVWKLETRDGAVMDADAAEHIVEAARVLSRYVQVLGVRSFPEGKSWATDRTDPVLASFARHATVPIINMESAVWHPCQALGDALTWNELGLKRGDRFVLSWAYHPKALPLAVPNSVMLAAAQRGLDVTILRPDEFALDKEMVAHAAKLAQQVGGGLRETSDMAALDGAKVIYAKEWTSLTAYGEIERERAIRSKYKDWQVTDAWMRRTAGGRGHFMHCLPVRRNVVVADGVLDSPWSAVVEQAENRLHAQQALLLKLLTA
jgi:N-acetylornithine carbamoyltransferase